MVCQNRTMWHVFSFAYSCKGTKRLWLFWSFFMLSLTIIAALEFWMFTKRCQVAKNLFHFVYVRQEQRKSWKFTPCTPVHGSSMATAKLFSNFLPVHAVQLPAEELVRAVPASSQLLLSGCCDSAVLHRHSSQPCDERSAFSLCHHCDCHQTSMFLLQLYSDLLLWMDLCQREDSFSAEMEMFLEREQDLWFILCPVSHSP